MENIKTTTNKCTQTDNPLVSIVLAAYKPNIEWFKMQLDSLNKQTYPNLNLYIYDDCPECPVDEEIIKRHITNFKYTIIRGKVNRGSNYAFEQLAKIADGEYLAFCDQDDKWMPEKISILMQAFQNKNDKTNNTTSKDVIEDKTENKTNKGIIEDNIDNTTSKDKTDNTTNKDIIRNKGVTLVCCDLAIMDGNSIKTHDSIKYIKKRIEYKSGYGLAKGLMIRNFVTGCAMIVRKDIAEKATPFPKDMYHDQWIAIIAALHGKIISLPDRLVFYRQHGSNQSQTLKGAYNKETYKQTRIETDIHRFEMYKERLRNYAEVKDIIDYGLDAAVARKRCYEGLSISNLKNVLNHKDIYKSAIYLELLSHFVPDFIFSKILSLIRHGII